MVKPSNQTNLFLWSGIHFTLYEGKILANTNLCYSISKQYGRSKPKKPKPQKAEIIRPTKLKKPKNKAEFLRKLKKPNVLRGRILF